LRRSACGIAGVSGVVAGAPAAVGIEAPEIDPHEQIYADVQQYIYDEATCLFMYQLVDIFGVDNWVVWEPRHDEMMWAHEMRWNT
jgi:hypothetical protein